MLKMEKSKQKKIYKDVSIIHDIDNLYLNQMLSHDLVLLELWRGERREASQ